LTKKEIWVFTEVHDGKIAPVSLELLEKGKELKNSLNAVLCSVLVGSHVSKLSSQVIACGVDRSILPSTSISKIIQRFLTARS